VTKIAQALAVGVVTMIVCSGNPRPLQAASLGQAQDAPPAPAKPMDLERVRKERQAQERLDALSVEILVMRFQGEKKVSSLPYTLAVNANSFTGSAGGGVAQLRMGANVPVPSLVAPKDNPAGPAGPMPGPVNYQDVGTNIDCNAQRMDDGSFQLRISVQDTSVYTNIQDKTTPTVGEMPLFRKFSSTNMLVLSNGQTREFTAATDRVSGEIVRVSVTLRVVK
jgi:hypothetical protein